ncbi:hypothetical protein K488DRAFT_89603 [Vararia minispora EC-137]|uniref:Uncharacterized protein n=1 Tax=Vararia minispora EC-137 TaxID=1314806 RepID=A0ACB8QA09_9AGAM|nr:hypothetical protein K488DRAFT_89603 [Vararia minispora EC-137]
MGDASRARTPELSVSTPYDPFTIDVYKLGIKRQFVDCYTNVEFLKPLIDCLNAEEPAQLFSRAIRSLRGNVGPFGLGHRLTSRDEGAVASIVLNTMDWNG